jgi:hypothetical protein
LESLKERDHSVDLGVDGKMDLMEIELESIDLIHLAYIRTGGVFL